MGNPVVHFEMMARDAGRIREFLSQLFGWRFEDTGDGQYFVVAHSDNHGAGGVGIGGGLIGGMEPGQDGAVFYVEVDDVDKALTRVVELGGTRIVGPMQMPGGPTFGHLLDPEGHHIGLFERGYRSGVAKLPADAEPKGSPVVHFEVIGLDYPTLERFYGEMFGWAPSTDNPVGYGVIARDDVLADDGIGIGGGIMALPEEMRDGGNGHVTWYVEVPDVEATLAAADRLGGQRLHGPDDVPGGPRLGQLADPEGHLIGVVERAD